MNPTKIFQRISKKYNLAYDGKTIGSKLRIIFFGICFKTADIFKFWHYPVNFDPANYSNIINKLNWNYKNYRPIIRAKRKSGIENYFNKIQKDTQKAIKLPEGFKKLYSIRLSSVGDLMRAKNLRNSIGRFYEKVEDIIFNADISIANLESAISISEPIERGFKNRLPGTNIQSSIEEFNAFKGHNGKNYTIFCTANNHIFDCGLDGFFTTHKKLEKEGILSIGTNLKKEDQKKCLTVRTKNIKLGLIAATYYINGKPFEKGIDSYLVNVVPFHEFKGIIDTSIIEKQIHYCKSIECDFIILHLHWGMEFEFFPRQSQINIAHHLIEFGADAIIGHHTHNIQPYELYQCQRDSHRRAPIFYGLGNLSSISDKPHRTLSLITNIQIVKGSINGKEKTLIESVSVDPVLQVDKTQGDYQYIQLEKLVDLANEEHLMNNKNLKKSIYYADLVLGRNWRKLEYNIT